MLLLFAFVFLAFGVIPDIQGRWKNNLGSVVDFRVLNNTLSGSYNSAVGHASGDYRLFGVISPDRTVVSWTVMWQNGIINTDSITTWVGLYSKDFIIATFLEVQNSSTAWNSTTVGQNIFYRLG